MVVDTLLRWYGHNPIAYVTISSKWTVVYVDMLHTAYPIITVTLTLLPWVVYLIHRKKHAKDHKVFVIRIIKWSVVGLLFGWWLPWLVLAITGGMAVRALYGNQGLF